MAQPANFKSPSRMGALGEDAPLSSSGSVSGGKSREEGLKGLILSAAVFWAK